MLWIAVLVGWLMVRAVIYRRDRASHGVAFARRRMMWSLVVLAVLYGAILMVLLNLENSLIYHPQTARESWDPPPGLLYQDVEIKKPDGDIIHGWWCPQDGSTITLLFSHGNAGNLSNHAWIIPFLRNHLKADVLIYDYPGYGKSTGKSGEQACYQSAEVMYDWLVRVKGIPIERIVLMGQSLGAAMACELAVERPHRALVLLSPFSSAGDMAQELFPVFPTKWLMSHRYDNLTKLSNYQKPILIGHARQDSVIPYRHAEKLFGICPSSQKRLYAIEEGDHNTLDSGFFIELRDFLERLP